MADSDINLAALWVPVMAETSGIKEQLKHAGEEGKRQFLEGMGGLGPDMEKLFNQGYNSAIKSSATKAGRDAAQQFLKGMEPQQSEWSKVGGQMGTGLLSGLKSSELSGGMTTILAGGFAGVVAAFVEGGLNVINKAFETTIDLAKDTADAVVKIGEAWHEVGRQIELSTTASGAKLEELNRSAQNVVRSGLDVSMNNLGSTMGVLSQRIGMTGTPLEQLTKDLLRVQDRFGEFKTGDFAGILKQFDVAPADASKTLDQLVNSARATSVSLPDLIAGAKESGTVLHQLGMDAGEAGAFVAQLNTANINAAPILKALQTSAKKLPPGESMADEIKGLVEQLDKAMKVGDVGKEQSLATKIFGPKWADALSAIQNGLLDTGTLIATFSDNGGQSLDQLLDHTATLSNKWTEFKNDASEALKSVGETAITLLEGPLEQFKQWFATNHDQIVAKIEDFGLKFIDALPHIRDFVSETIEILGALANPIKELGMLVAGIVLPVTELFAKVTFNDKLYDTTLALGDNLNKIEGIDFGKAFADASDYVHSMSIDSDGLKRNLQDAADAADSINSGLGSLSNPFTHNPFSGAPSGGTTSTGSDGQTYHVAPQSLSIPMPSVSTGNSSLASVLSAQGLSPQQIRLVQAFSQVEGNNASGNPTLGFSDAKLGGDTSMQGHVAALLQQFKNRQSVSGPFPQSGSDQDQAQWIAKVVGQPLAGINAPDTGDYVTRVKNAMQGVPVAGSPGGPGTSPNGALNLSTIPIAAQKYANDCIDASARIILSHSGVNMTEDQLEGVIAPGGSIDSQAAGLNRLDPQGKFVAMQGSGGSQQAMFSAIKASIDNSIGSILNVAPGSSLAGHTFAPGHFIAATGYNPDGTINVSDTAGGKTYSVSQADAFQATQGRGIVAGTGIGPTGMPATIPGAGSGGPMPTVPYKIDFGGEDQDDPQRDVRGATPESPFATKNPLGLLGQFGAGGAGAPLRLSPEEGRDWASKVWTQSRDDFSQEQRDAISNYTSQKYSTAPLLNNFLRAPQPERFSAYYDDIVGQIGNMDGAIDNAARVPSPLVVSRGVNRGAFGGVDPKDAASLIGKPFYDPGYLSTSVGENAVPSEHADKDYLLNLLLPPGTRGLYTSHGLSGYGDSENELLLGRGNTITPQSVSKNDKGQTVVDALLAQVRSLPPVPGNPYAGIRPPSGIPRYFGEGFPIAGGMKLDFGDSSGDAGTLGPDLTVQPPNPDLSKLLLGGTPQAAPTPSPLDHLPITAAQQPNPVKPPPAPGDTTWSNNLNNATPLSPQERNPSAFDTASAPDDGDQHMPDGDTSNIQIPAMTGNYEIDSRNLSLVNQQIEIARKQDELVKEIAALTDGSITDPQKLAEAKQKVQLDQDSLGVDKEKLQADAEKPVKGDKSLDSDAEKFGSGFLKGIFSDLGFGNVLGGKSPLDWGVVKLLGGLAGWGLGEANAWGDTLAAAGKLPGGAPGLSAGGGGGLPTSIMSGFLKDLAPGMNPLKPGAALGPSSAAVPMANPNGSIAQGQGTGPAPGPVDNRIIVSGNTVADPTQFLPAIQAQQNQRVGGANSSVNGALPAPAN